MAGPGHGRIGRHYILGQVREILATAGPPQAPVPAIERNENEKGQGGVLKRRVLSLVILLFLFVSMVGVGFAAHDGGKCSPATKAECIDRGATPPRTVSTTLPSCYSPWDIYQCSAVNCDKPDYGCKEACRAAGVPGNGTCRVYNPRGEIIHEVEL